MGEFETLKTVGAHLNERITRGVASGALSDQASSIGRLFHGMQSERLGTIVFELAGAAGGTWVDDDGVLADRGIDFLMRQVGSIAGRHHRDVAQRPQRAGPRHAAGADDGQGGRVPRRAPQRVVSAHHLTQSKSRRSFVSDTTALGRWIDKLEIREIIERSVRYIDDQDGAAFAELFEEDGVLQLAGTVFAGREALARHVPGADAGCGSGRSPASC